MQLRLFKEQRTVIAALRNQIVNAFEKPYLQTLHRPHIGFNNCTIQELFNYLYNNYGKISDNDILTNMDEMKQAWEPDTPIEMLYKQIEDGAEYASLAGLTIPDKEKIAIEYNLIYQTGELPIACKDWRRMPNATKTWNNFK